MKVNFKDLKIREKRIIAYFCFINTANKKVLPADIERGLTTATVYHSTCWSSIPCKSLYKKGILNRERAIGIRGAKYFYSAKDFELINFYPNFEQHLEVSNLNWNTITKNVYSYNPNNKIFSNFHFCKDANRFQIDRPDYSRNYLASGDPVEDKDVITKISEEKATEELSIETLPTIEGPVKTVSTNIGFDFTVQFNSSGLNETTKLLHFLITNKYSIEINPKDNKINIS